MNLAYLTVSMDSARSAAAHLSARGFDGEAFLSMVTASLYDMQGEGLGIKGVKALDTQRGDGRVDGASAFVPPPAPVAYSAHDAGNARG
ncbi:MAG: hypothetical protein DI582_01725 [Azospirillum brasilense]|nr:MAG: hypothetical protein DI582_01725 [Azospirillum brasilense]